MWLEDVCLRWLQRRCQHPGNMVAVDILEGDAPEIRVGYCRRCGSVRRGSPAGGDAEWRTPDPFFLRRR